jgi:hypothetical protein
MTQCMPFTCNDYVPDNKYDQTHKRSVILPHQKDTLIDVNILVTFRHNIKREYTPELGVQQIMLRNAKQTFFNHYDFGNACWISENQLIIPVDISIFDGSIDMKKHKDELKLSIIYRDNYFVESTGLIYNYAYQ